MKTSELLTALRDFLKDDSEILNWSNEKYEHGHFVALGVNMKDPPSTAMFPLIMIIGAKKISSSSSNRLIWEVRIGFAVGNNKKIELENTVTYTGLLQCEDFKDKVEDVLSKKGFGAKISFESDPQDIKDFPQFVSGSILTIEMIKRRRL